MEKFRRNLRAIRERIGPDRLICVPVKADAYGHGAAPIAAAAVEAAGVCLGVATVTEGAELRNAGFSVPILLFSQPLPDEIPELVSLDLSPFVSDGEFVDLAARTAAAAGKTLSVHLKIDTGMGRVGCRPEDAAALAGRIVSRKGLILEGTATHLAVSDSPKAEDLAYTRTQLARFREALASIRGAGINPGIVHAANSGAVILHQDAFFDMVRPGILLYGYSPVSGEASVSSALQVEPVMELVSRIVFIKKVKQGESLSYGRTWTAPEDTMIATIPVGYGDGLPRLLSGNWQVYIRGKPYPLAGRICMDQCLANLGPGSDIKRWEDVVIFGGAAPGADQIAARINTIPYEITCNINKRVPRIYNE
ncbi:alanine racemase [Spirochaetia bacterium]|nr:alanine racemase [Spirochaetia bacterium]